MGYTKDILDKYVPRGEYWTIAKCEGQWMGHTQEILDMYGMVLRNAL